MNKKSCNLYHVLEYYVCYFSQSTYSMKFNTPFIFFLLTWFALKYDFDYDSTSHIAFDFSRHKKRITCTNCTCYKNELCLDGYL